MKAIKWLLITLAVVFIACEPVIEDDNCYRDDNQVKMCQQIRDKMEHAWNQCYDGQNEERDLLLHQVFEIAENKCNATECLPEDSGLDCAGETWECIENEFGEQDLRIPYSCNMAISW
jgi:hypothetical protein